MVKNHKNRGKSSIEIQKTSNIDYENSILRQRYEEMKYRTLSDKIKWILIKKYIGVRTSETIYHTKLYDIDILLKFLMVSKQGQVNRFYEIVWNGQPEKIERMDYELLERIIMSKNTRNNASKCSNENKREKTAQRLININSFVVRVNTFYCHNRNHAIERIAAMFPILKINGMTEEIRVDAGYCNECNVHFIMERDYLHLKKIGIILCNIVNQTVFYKHGPWCFEHSNVKESILKQNGYNVSRINNLSNLQRQIILTHIIENGLTSRDQVISYLSMFIRQKKVMPAYQEAVNKWKSDLIYISNYSHNTRRIEKADKIIAKKYIER